MTAERVEAWFAARGWTPFPFQRDAWAAYLAGRSGLIHATTGTGKTLAAWLGPVLQALAEWPEAPSRAPGSENRPTTRRKRADSPPLRVLWITPLRALAADTEQALRAPLADLGLDWTLESRTGDTSSAVRNRQRKRLPTALVTTPESLSLQLTYPDARERFADLRCVIVDEWHELLGSKRGSQTELALARLRRWRPTLRTWALSATLGNLDEALNVLIGTGPSSSPSPLTTHHSPPTPLLISAAIPKTYVVDTLIPDAIERFPWAGHLGLKQVPAVVQALESAKSAIVFTNTRAQTELWYQAILKARPAWAGQIALHHGSLDQETRRWVEAGLRDGRLRCVVSTSSLDLGVDFSPVERVLQVGSPKGVGRLLQRAGRSGHQPGVTSRVTCVPTHAFELAEIAAVREALHAYRIEARRPLAKPLDVLVQHAVTCALGGGFTRDDLLAEVRTAHSFRDLTDAEWDWCLDFITRGGEALRAYPEYRRVVIENPPSAAPLWEGEAPAEPRDDASVIPAAPDPPLNSQPSTLNSRYTVPDPLIAKRHRLSVGTITSDASIEVRFLKGGRLGTIEEGFVSRLKPGERFVFAGRPLELVRVFDMKAWVRKAAGPLGPVPRWQGGRMPLSTELAAAVRAKLDDARRGLFDGPEMAAVRPVLELQKKWSRLPMPNELLVETLKTREGHHAFFYPFAGRTVHEGLATLVAYRLSRLVPITFAISVNDYGFELLTPSVPEFAADPSPLSLGRGAGGEGRSLANGAPSPPSQLPTLNSQPLISLLRHALATGLLSPANLRRDILASLNSVEMAKRRFREVARVAGLAFVGYPGGSKTSRQLQASTGLIFDVFKNYDPSNLLLRQAEDEVLDQQLDASRLAETLRRLDAATVVIEHPRRPTPLAFPLLVDRLRERLSSEKLADRVRRMTRQLERAAGR